MSSGTKVITLLVKFAEFRLEFSQNNWSEFEFEQIIAHKMIIVHNVENNVDSGKLPNFIFLGVFQNIKMNWKRKF